MDKKQLEQLLSNCPYIYQPIYGLAKENQPVSARNGYDRLSTIKDVYSKISSAEKRPLKVLDLGCNAGFYSFELARLGADVTGVETNKGFYNLCNYLKDVSGLKTVSFLNENFVELYAENKLGSFDLILGLSIFHHIASKYTYKKAREILEGLAYESSILLELALHDEVGAKGRPEGPSWAKSQPKNYRDWLVNFDWTHEISRFKTPSSQTSRPMLFGSNKFIIRDSKCIKINEAEDHSQTINIYSNTINIQTLNAKDF